LFKHFSVKLVNRKSKYNIMADDKTKQDGRDDSRIDGNDPSELSNAAEQFGVSVQAVKDAIQAVGNSREKVRQHLSK
jgi:hypothetical protein